MSQGLVFTVTTLKDRRENVEFFVRANLAGGVDHLVVILDDPAAPGQPEVRAWLDAQPQVTCIPGDATWWQGERPAGLNPRQRQSANAVKAALADVDGATWVFHIDGDEVAWIDRDALAAVPADVDAVQLRPLEAVAQWHAEGRPTRFKQLLDEDDLQLLTVLGVLDRPTNGLYFRGHIEGKTGLRPASPHHLTLHRPVDEAREPVTPYDAPGLAVLHYESVSGEEFVRKWSAIVASGPAPALRPIREGTGAALRAVLAKDLAADVRTRILGEIFDRTCRDDVATLADLGLLSDIDPLRGAHRPATLPAAAEQQWRTALARVAATPKSTFGPGGTSGGNAGATPGGTAADDGPGSSRRRGRRR